MTPGRQGGEGTAGTPRPIAALAREWEQLAAETGASPFDDPGWATIWWNAFGSGQLEVHSVGDSGLRALVPMRVASGGLHSLTNWHSHTSGLLARDESAVGDLVASLLTGRPHQVSIGFLESDAWQTAALARAIGERGYRVVLRPLTTPPFLDIDGTFAEYTARMSRNLRGNLRRRQRMLAGSGTAVFEVHDGSERLDELMDEGLAVEGSGWKVAAGSAILSQPETERFYRDVARWAAARDLLRLDFLRLDGRCIAFELNVQSADTLYDIKGGYDVEFAYLSPGLLLQEAAVRRAFDLELRRVDFLGNFERYKMAWATGIRQTVTLMAFAPTPIGRSRWLVERHARPLAKRVKGLLRPRPHGDGSDSDEARMIRTPSGTRVRGRFGTGRRLA